MKKNALVKGLILAVAATFALAGCGANGGASNASESSASSISAASSSNSADLSWDKVKEKGELVMGLDESFPPMGFRDDSNNIVGYDVDLAQEVATRLGVKLKLQPINWDTKEQELNTGNIDCIWNGFTITDERKENILFSQPYMNNQQVIVVLADSKFKTLADLKGKTLALQAASSAADALDSQADFKATLKEVVQLKDNNLCLMDLKTGNVEAVAMDEIVARYYIQMKSEKYRVLDEGLAKEEYGIGFRKADTQLMTKVNDALKEMSGDGKMAEISNKWFGKDISTINLSWEKVKEKGELIMGLDDSFPPMGFRDDSNNIVGYDVDLAQEVATRLGVKLKLQPINWDTKEQELNTGNIDCIWNGFTITDERKENILFSQPYMKNQQVIVVLANSKFNTLADLKGKSLALQAASSAADALDSKADFKATLKEVVQLKDNNLCLMDLKTGNVDAVAMDEIVARYYIQMKSEKYRVLDEGLTKEEYGIGFRKADTQLMNKVNDTLKEMAGDGKMAEISNKWFGKDISTIK